MRSPLENIDKVDQTSKLIGGYSQNLWQKERPVFEDNKTEYVQILISSHNQPHTSALRSAVLLSKMEVLLCLVWFFLKSAGG